MPAQFKEMIWGSGEEEGSQLCPIDDCFSGWTDMHNHKCNYLSIYMYVLGLHTEHD